MTTSRISGLASLNTSNGTQNMSRGESGRSLRARVARRLMFPIDLDIYKCVAEDIITDEVILTDERMGHIIYRRGQEFYDMFHRLFGTVLSNPDYIFKYDSTNTVIVCKQFVEHEKTVNIVLRLVVEGDNPKYKNSILTAIGENNRLFEQRLRNNTSIYAKKNLGKTE
ncbi:MAG: hypothetical protein ACI4JY_10830 [Oscillospiraceae bacterium]